VQRFDRYIAKNLLTTTLFAVAILSGVFLLGNIFKEARPLFVGKHPSPFLILEFIFSVLPYSLLFTIPFSFLAAVMLVFGRLSADNEILSMRMAGRSLPRIALPVFIVAALLSGFCFWLNSEMSPKAKARVKTLLVDAVKDDPNKFLDPGVVQTQLADKRIYVRERKKINGEDILYGLHIHDISAFGTDEAEGSEKPTAKDENPKPPIEDTETKGASTFYVYAESAKLEVDLKNSQIKLDLKNAFAITSDENKENPDLRIKYRAEFAHAITSRQSFSLACLAFALVGVPLGIGAKRKDSSTGFILSILIGLGYFLFHIFASEIEDDTSTVSTILFWLPNILALIIGVWLFRRFRSK